MAALERIHPSLSVLYSPADWESINVYKRKYNDMIGRTLRKEYENGKIRLENEFMEVLKRVLSDSKEI